MKLIMRLTITLCWIFISRFAGFSIDNSVAVCFQKGDSLKELGQLEMARIEYERAGFFAEDNQTKTLALIRKSECYLLQNQFSNAERSLARINYAALPDSIIFKARYTSAFSSYLAQNFENAESQLLQLNYFVRDTGLKYSALLLQVLVLNELDKFQEAKNKLDDWLIHSHLTQQQKDSVSLLFNAMYAVDALPHYKSLKKAQNLSMLLPGTGQWYAGYFWDGAMSAGFQLAGLALLGYNIYAKYYICGVIYGFGIFQRFYAGGIKRTEFLVNKRNYLVKRKFNDGVKSELLRINKQYGY